MKCRVCSEDKLSKEFPYETVTTECDHPALYCLECVIEKVRKHAICPYNECEKPVDDPEALLEQCQNELDQLYPPVQMTHQTGSTQTELPSDLKSVITVTTMTGDVSAIDYLSTMTVDQLKEIIKERLKVDVNKQLLVYNGTPLEPVDGSGKEMKLQDYQVQPFTTIHLMVLLYAIPEHFNHVVFDLHWGYPARGTDYLDASCLIYSGKSFQNVVDYRHNSQVGIKHSGDVMDDVNRIGHHTIEVHLKDIPASINHLFFTLSAWISPTIAHFPNPSLKFFEAADMKKDLCKTTFTDANHSQAVIMCSVSRSGSGIAGNTGRWRIVDGGKVSAGNAKNYEPLQTSIQELIKKLDHVKQ